ncbi:MAG: hypothetical protein WA919_23035 [Coleofasciculaceae cyanobacterium]
MKKQLRLIPALLGLTAINLVAITLPFTQKAEAITPSDWQGSWTCNFDGQQQPLQITFRQHYNLVIGQIGSNAWALQQREFDSSSDPPTSRKDHVLPLLYRTNNEKWFLMLHTWNTNYASGFSRWRGSVYGMFCTRQ